MTDSKQKAQTEALRLVEKFKFSFGKMNGGDMSFSTELAKKCSILCCKEIVETLEDNFVYKHKVKFYEEVIQAIEELK